MKLILILLSIFFIQNTYAQEVELKGKYSASFMGAETINFVGKDSFYFDGFYCINGVKGKGRCEIRNNYLILNFEKAKPKTRIDSLQLDEIETSISLDSFSVLKINCLNTNGDATQYFNVMVTKNGKNITSYAANNNGLAELKIKKSIYPLELKITGIGIVTKTITLKAPLNYTLKLIHDENNDIEILNKGEQMVYEIEELTEELITMKPKGSNGKFYKYRRHN